MKRNKAMALAAIVGSLLCVKTVDAASNGPFTIEFHAGPSFPSEDIGDADLDDGFGAGASFAYNFLNGKLGVYTDFEVSRFEADSPTDAELDAVTLFGYGLGVTHKGTFTGGPIGYFVSGGLHLSQLRLYDDDDDTIEKTKFDIGFQTSAGIDYSLDENWTLRTGFLYKTFARRLKNSTNPNDAELDIASLTFGATYSF